MIEPHLAGEETFSNLPNIYLDNGCFGTWTQKLLFQMQQSFDCSWTAEAPWPYYRVTAGASSRGPVST